MIKTKTYACGVRLVVEETNHKECTLGIGINCGSKDEKPDEFGLAHFNEHLFFKSTKTRTTKELATEIENLGAEMNAWTSEDKTYFYLKILNEKLEKGFELYCDMFFNGIFEKNEVDKEREVVLEEFKLYEDGSFSRLSDSCLDIIFAGSAYSHPVLGDKKVIKNASIAKIKNFKKKHYKPENIIISISGGVKFNKIIKMVDKYFCSKFNCKKAPRIVNTKSFQIKFPKHYLNIQKEDKQARLLIFVKSENVTGDNIEAQSIYATIMGTGMSSRMFSYLREQQGLCYATSTGLQTFINAGNILFYIAAAPEKIKDCVKGIKFLIKEAAEKGFSKDEFEKAKTMLKSNIVFASTTSRKANSNFNTFSIFNKPLTENEKIKRLENVKIEDVNNFAKRIANENNFLVATIGNKIDTKNLKLFEK